MACVKIGPLHNLSDVMSKISTRGLVVVDEANFSSNNLGKPDCSAVAYSKIPRGKDHSSRLMRHPCNPLVGVGLPHQLAVIGADDSSLEAALELLRVLLFRQSAFEAL
jgi:hypothetical protein